MHLEYKQVQLLLHLLAHAGRTVKKNTLIERVWSGRVVVDDVLSVAVSQLRKALKDNARAPTYIKTIPGEGYQFIHPMDLAEVDKARLSIGLEPLLTPPPPIPEEPHTPILDFNGLNQHEAEALFFPPSNQSRQFKWLLATLLVPVIAVAGYHFVQPASEALGITDKRAPIFAVLPLENFSDNQSLDNYSDSLTEVLISELAKNTNFLVISRTSVTGFKGQQKPLPEIAKKLKADLVLEGALIQSSGNTEVSLQLIDARNDHHLWAERFNTDAGEVEPQLIAAKTLESIVAKIPEGKKPGVVFNSQTPSEEAQALYRRAETLLQTWQYPKMREAMRLLEDAIRKDGTFVKAYITLATIKRNLLFGEQLTLYNASSDIKALLQKAISVDPASADAHLLLAWTYFIIDWNFVEAEKHYLKAIEINKSHVEAHSGYAQLLIATGRFPEAHHHTRIVRELDPLAYSIPIAAWIYTMERRYDDAWKETEKLLALDPDSIAYHRSAQSILEYMGRERESYQHLKRMLELSGYSQEDIGHAENLYAEGGMKAVYNWLAFTKKELENIGQYNPPVSLARYAVKAGKTQKALDWLEQAYNEHRVEVLWLAVDPKYDSLHDEPRFLMLLKKIGLSLPPNQAAADSSQQQLSNAG